MRNLENPFVIVKKIEINSPQDGCQMVDLDLIPAKLLYIIVTTYL
jgi:hypothetical protein